MSFYQKNQLARIRFAGILTITLAATIIMSFYVLGHLTQTPLSLLTRDLPATTNSRIYLGLLSRLGEMLWAGTAAVCLMGAMLLYSPAPQSALFLLCSGLLSLLLTLDDALMLHEHLAPEVLGISEIAVYVTYLVLMLVYLLRFKERILSTEYFLLVTACVFFALSMSMDVFVSETELGTFVEDSFKFVGIIFWLLYFVRVTLHLTQAALPHPHAD